MLSFRFTNLEPLGDQAVLATLPSASEALRFANAARTLPPPWQVDTVLAYAAVAVFFDPRHIDYEQAAARLRSLRPGFQALAVREVIIPCCYERGPDLVDAARALGLRPDRLMALHAGTRYAVYAIGFCPGFPYLGYLPPELCGLPRRAEPRVRVEAGSVGITGRQTAVYPLNTPGGWALVGQTPLELVNVADGYFPLRVGDSVRFRRIDAAEFNRLRGQRLPPR